MQLSTESFVAKANSKKIATGKTTKTSNINDNNLLPTDRSDVTLNSMTGEIIEAMSDLSLPSVDFDNEFNEASPRVKLDDMDYYVDKNGIRCVSPKISETRLRTKSGDSSPGSPSDVIERMGSSKDLGSEGNYRRNEKDMSENVTDNAQFEDVKKKSRAKLAAPLPQINLFSKKKVRGAQNMNTINEIGIVLFETRYMIRPSDIVVIAVSMIHNHHELYERERQMASRWLSVWDDCTRDYSMLVKKGKNICGL